MKRHTLFSIFSLVAALVMLVGCGGQAVTPAPSSSSGSSQGEPPTQPDEPGGAPLGLPDEMRAMWIAYPDLELVDFATEEQYTAQLEVMLDDCVDMKLNTVIFIVRPFSDAMYPSSVYPWSYLVNGVQGVDPGYDPLGIAVEQAHARGLRLEAYINPYRVKLSSTKPGVLSADNPALMHPELVREVDESLWYDPGMPEVRQLVVDGVREIVENYEVDGIHFDDYFYPAFSSAEQDEAFDAETYAQYGAGMDRAAWRRQNVDTLVVAVYDAIKEINPAVSFGISPQGNNENNYNGQYSDVELWLATPGYVDYVMPQLYWGFGWRSASGANTAAFDQKCAEWAGYERHASVRLYAGLGAYRIGVGDGSVGEQDEWFSGHAIADQIEHLRTVDGFSGYGLFRYEHLSSEDEPLFRQEAASIAAVN